MVQKTAVSRQEGEEGPRLSKHGGFVNAKYKELLGSFHLSEPAVSHGLCATLPLFALLSVRASRRRVCPRRQLPRAVRLLL